MNSPPRILLTGSTGGIGGAVAEALAAKKCRLVLSGRDSAKLEVLVARFRAKHGAEVDVIPAPMKIIAPLMMVSPEKAAHQFVHAALDPRVGARNGGWIRKGKLKPMPRKLADPSVGERFWSLASATTERRMPDAA